MRSRLMKIKLVSLVPITFFIIIATVLSSNVYAEGVFEYDELPCATYLTPVCHYAHHRFRHHYQHHKYHHRRHVNYSSVSVYSIGCPCAGCCTAWSPGYTVYTTLPDYAYGCDWSAGNYDPPNLSPYEDDINADYNMTY